MIRSKTFRQIYRTSSRSISTYRDASSRFPRISGSFEAISYTIDRRNWLDFDLFLSPWEKKKESQSRFSLNRWFITNSARTDLPDPGLPLSQKYFELPPLPSSQC
jgi:hypothetical protein